MAQLTFIRPCIPFNFVPSKALIFLVTSDYYSLLYRWSFGVLLHEIATLGENIIFLTTALKKSAVK